MKITEDQYEEWASEPAQCKHEWSKGKMFYGKSDCPCCEIDRLKAELEEANTIADDNYQVILKLRSICTDLERQLAEANDLIARDNTVIQLLIQERNEARAEVAELKDFKKALERIANTPDDYEMEYCRNIAIIALEELI